MDTTFSANFPEDDASAMPHQAMSTDTVGGLAGERPAVLQTVNLASSAPTTQTFAPAAPDWVLFARRRWRWLCLGSVGFLALLATSALVNTRTEQLEGSTAATQPNQVALLELTTIEFGALEAEVDLQLDATYERLIDLEATRFLQEAEKQIQDDRQPCYRQGTACVLDQFEADAVALYHQGTETLDRQQQLDALRRIAIVDRARAGVRLATEPDNALTLLAIQKRLEARRLQRAATAEGMAADLVMPNNRPLDGNNP